MKPQAPKPQQEPPAKRYKTKSKNPQYNIEKTFVVSTGHITTHDDDILTKTMIAIKEEFGYKLNLNDRELVEELTAAGCSAALLNLVNRGGTLGCDNLLIDSDGPIYGPELGHPVFEW